MAAALQRATFNRSGLVRLLAETLPNAPDAQYDFGERLGQWLDFTDALSLFSVLNQTNGAAAHAPARGSTSPLPAQLERVRSTLSEAIRNDGVFSPEPARIRFPTPLPDATPDTASDFSPYHRYYLAHQRDMSNAIAALRVNARQALLALGPAQRQLAELDAGFEKVLLVRERKLLAHIPLLLAKRFAERYNEHRTALNERGTDDNPADWTRPGSWLEAFCRDTQAVLLAELALRLKTVTGLISALGQTDAPLMTSKP